MGCEDAVQAYLSSARSTSLLFFDVHGTMLFYDVNPAVVTLVVSTQGFFTVVLSSNEEGLVAGVHEAFEEFCGVVVSRLLQHVHWVRWIVLCRDLQSTRTTNERENAYPLCCALDWRKEDEGRNKHMMTGFGLLS
ncbi:hypothetical protein VNO80_27278 [Phaseolus coccineus]|uniref:Uncharacterized protein n=1 Tax=Phaseolus coccineus TaxID=3886 RepID=A0AAN9QHW8_PHACN